MKITLKVRVINKGLVEGEALTYQKPFSLRDVNPVNGIIDLPDHELFGKSVRDKIMVYPCGCGASSEDWLIYVLKRAGVAPKAIVNGVSIFYINVAGAILADIPMVYGLDQNCLSLIQDGDRVKVDADRGLIEVSKTNT